MATVTNPYPSNESISSPAGTRECRVASGKANETAATFSKKATTGNGWRASDFSKAIAFRLRKVAHNASGKDLATKITTDGALGEVAPHPTLRDAPGPTLVSKRGLPHRIRHSWDAKCSPSGL
jgi:hypothetical protein